MLFCGLTLPTRAETTDNSKVDLLQAQVDSLSHQVDYLNLIYEISTLNTDIKLFCHDIASDIMDMKMNIYHNDCRGDIYYSYKELYDAYIIDFKAFEDLIKAKQLLFVAMLVAKNYTDSEKDVLMKSLNMTDSIYHSAELQLNMMKDVLDIYHKQI